MTSPTVPSTAAPTQPPTTAPTQPPTTAPTQPPTEAPTQPPTEAPRKKLIVIDAGHQAKANYDKEPLGPGAAELKTKVSSGTQGVATGLEEYRLNLMVAEKLRQILEDRGYETVMIRTTHDVNISNAERAQIANELQADAFIRIHANGSDNPQTNGILTICQTKSNPYNSQLYDASYLLSQQVLDEMAEATGAKRLYVWETDTMSGINWCQIPVTIVEMGFMSNEAEDRKMATDAYQTLLAQGIANGIDRYFEILQ
jgi:N-acetylmuramoyl-L-alanine amidase